MGLLTTANEVYEIGRTHYYKGVNLDNCPYHFFGNQRPNYLTWRAGWIAAQNEDIAANV